MIKKLISVLAAVTLLCTAMAMPAFAISMDEIQKHIGPGGFHNAAEYLESIGLDESAIDGYYDGDNYSKLVDGDTTYYYYEGKKYVEDYCWGQHYLTGYSPSAAEGSMTRSGKNARARHTISGPYSMLGKVAFVRSVSGPRKGVYDGVYVFEDTGGPAVETGIPSTMNTPVVDIFFNTDAEAQAVTGPGWTTAEVVILREVE